MSLNYQDTLIYLSFNFIKILFEILKIFFLFLLKSKLKLTFFIFLSRIFFFRHISNLQHKLSQLILSLDKPNIYRLSPTTGMSFLFSRRFKITTGKSEASHCQSKTHKRYVRLSKRIHIFTLTPPFFL